MVIGITSSVVDRGFESRSSQTKDYKFVFVGFSAKPAALRKKTDRLGIRIMCYSEATCLPTDGCSSKD